VHVGSSLGNAPALGVNVPTSRYFGSVCVRKQQSLGRVEACASAVCSTVVKGNKCT